MGRVNNLTDITGILTFEERVEYATVKQRLEERLLRFDRFTQHVGGRKRQLRRPYWAPTPGFDIETHLTHVALPEPQDKAAFERFVSRLASHPLDERRPLWLAYLVEGVDDANAIVFRINHSVADGFALLYVLLGLADDPEAMNLPVGSVPTPPRVGDEGGPRTTHETDATPDPDRITTGSLLDVVRTGLSAITTGWELLTLDPEPDTSLRGDLSTRKGVAWTAPIDLAAVKRLGREHDATVNDVMMGATAGAFRRVLQDRGEPVEGLELRASVPVNLKPMEERTESLGNYFGLVFVPMPVGEPDLADRIRIMHERMDERKAGVEAFLIYLTFTFGGFLPDRGMDKLLKQFEDQATGVVTNVPGPTESFEFAGKEVSDVLVWAPSANDQGLSLTIFSYDGSIRVGVAADAGLLPEPRALSDALEAEIAALTAPQT
jgi:WS/DGAT/MGAT family acyltransferase